MSNIIKNSAILALNTTDYPGKGYWFVGQSLLSLWLRQYWILQVCWVLSFVLWNYLSRKKVILSFLYYISLETQPQYKLYASTFYVLTAIKAQFTKCESRPVIPFLEFSSKLSKNLSWKSFTNLLFKSH
jgi:hypothetical protein